MKNTKGLLSVKDIVEMGLFIALAIVLDMPFLKIKLSANGGSISLVMLPLFFLAYRKGLFKSFLAIGIVFGFIDCLIDGYGIITFPFDYLLAYGSISLASLFKNKILLEEYSSSGVINIILSFFAVFVFRCIFHTFSGMFIYGLDFISSLIYQLMYLVPSFIISSIGMVILYKPLIAINKRYK